MNTGLIIVCVAVGLVLCIIALVIIDIIAEARQK